MRHVAAADSHIVYSLLSKEYGPVMQCEVLGRVLIVISDAKIALDLLEKRGAVYSGRPKFYMATESGFSWAFAVMGQTDTWRTQRQLVHQHFRAKSIPQMHMLLRRNALRLGQKLLSTPHAFREHIQHGATASILRTVYGIKIATVADPYAEVVARAMEAVTAAVVPGRNLMDALPFLRHVPGWVPALGLWTARTQKTRKLASAMLEVPYARAHDDLRAGRSRPCMVHEALDSLDADSSVTEHDIKAACAIAYFAGADTIVATLLSFVMAMVLWPECQKKAQAELDRVLGNRLPEFVDRESLPCVEAVIRETYRLYPAGTLGIPHAVDEEDEYNGYFIRRGSTILVNVWHSMHNAETYPEPERFNPERWAKDGKIDETVQDPRSAIFGFGRRICPGRHFADAAVFINIATVLKSFDLSCHVEDGVEVPPSGKIIVGLTSCPAPFKCRITPRSEKIGGMIDMALETCTE